MLLAWVRGDSGGNFDDDAIVDDADVLFVSIMFIVPYVPHSVPTELQSKAAKCTYTRARKSVRALSDSFVAKAQVCVSSSLLYTCNMSHVTCCTSRVPR